MYFSLSNGVFKPFRGQSKVLDKKFMENVVVTKNIANYNEYTNSIISKSKNGEYFYSDKFSYDASNFTFNFFELHKCESESDFQQMYAYYIGVPKEYQILYDQHLGYNFIIDMLSSYCCY